MTTLVTGATGFVGRSVRKLLLAHGVPFRPYRGDINDFTRLREELSDVEVVLHLAGGEARGRTHWLAYVDVEGTDTLLKALRYRPARRLVVISRFNADPNALYPLLRAKGIVEQKVRQSGVPYTIVRSASIFGSEDRFTNAIAATAAWSWPLVWLPGGGETAMQPLWVEDVARCLVTTLRRDDLLNQTIEIAGDERLRYYEIVRLVLEAANLRRLRFKAPVLLARAANSMTRWAWEQPPLHQFDHDRLSTPEVTSLDTVLTQFGFRPARLHNHLSHLRHGVYRQLFRF
jgi:NADH dehydrogenase